MKESIGFMGLGIMGAAMAGNILRSGYPLTVYNRTVERTRPLAAAGARVASSPRALANAAEVIIAMVTGPEALDSLLWGQDGAAAAMAPDKTFINSSTVSPSYTRALGKRLAELKLSFIDAPVSGSKKPAEEANLLFLAGGDRQQIEQLTPLFQTMGEKVIYCGEIGQGSMMKMAVNLLLGIMMEGMAEMFTFGRQGGLAPEALLETIFSGSLASALYKSKAEMLKTGTFPTQFPLKHMCKDLKFVLDTAYEIGAPVPAGLTLLHLYRLGVSQNLGDQDFAAILRVLEHLINP